MLVADMWSVGAVLNGLLAAAVVPASAQVGVQRLEDHRVELRDGVSAQDRADVLVGLAHVVAQCAAGQVGADLEVAVEQLVD